MCLRVSMCMYVCVRVDLCVRVSTRVCICVLHFSHFTVVMTMSERQMWKDSVCDYSERCIVRHNTAVGLYDIIILWLHPIKLNLVCLVHSFLHIITIRNFIHMCINIIWMKFWKNSITKDVLFISKCVLNFYSLCFILQKKTNLPFQSSNVFT